MPDAEPEASLDDAAAAGVIEGWALNVSRGGLRVILEHRVDLGAEFEITICEVGAEPTSPQPGRVVWIQDEPDGVIAGIEFRVPSGGATG